MEMIVIEKRIVGNEEINSVDARDLHSRLGLKSEFSNWIKQNIKKLNLVENVDYCSFDKIVERENGGTTRIEYILTLDTGKHIAMMTNTSTAHDIRTYFIEFEKKSKATPTIHDPQTRALMLLLAETDAMKHEQRMMSIQQQVISTGLAETRNEVAQIKAQQITRDESYFTAAGFCNLKGIKLDRAGMAMIGKMAAQHSRENGFKIGKVYDSRYGEVNEYHTDSLQYAVRA